MIELLLTRAEAAGVPLTREQAEKIEAYHRMLTEANARFNLTRVPDDPEEAVDRNYLDCLMPLQGEMPGLSAPSTWARARAFRAYRWRSACRRRTLCYWTRMASG